MFDDDHELFRDSVPAVRRQGDRARTTSSGKRPASSTARAVRRRRRARASSAWRCRRSTAAAASTTSATTPIIGEEIQRAGVGGAGLGITLHNDICLPYFLALLHRRAAGSAGCRASASGELITAIAMTEPGIGSDLASMTTTAIRDGDHYVVNGSKTFITNGINADLVITAVKTDPSQRHAGMSLLVLERGMDGLRARPQPREDRPARPGHRRAVLQRRARAGRQPARRGGRGLPAPRAQPAPGAAVDRRRRRRRRPRRARLDARVREGAHRRSASRSARSRTAGSRWPRWRPRSRSRQAFVDRCVARPQRRRAHRRGGGDGEVVVHRAAEARRRPLRPAARRLRLHARVPDRPRLRRRPHHHASTAARPRS